MNEHRSCIEFLIQVNKNIRKAMMEFAKHRALTINQVSNKCTLEPRLQYRHDSSPIAFLNTS